MGTASASVNQGNNNYNNHVFVPNSLSELYQCALLGSIEGGAFLSFIASKVFECQITCQTGFGMAL